LHGVSHERSLSLAHWLQPFDGLVEARRVEAGLSTWPWADWAGRSLSEWHWAMARSRAGDLDASRRMQAAERAVQERPFWAPGYYWLGLAQVESGWPGAERSMERALALEPRFSRVLAWQAEQRLKAGGRAAALGLVERIRAIQSLKMASEDLDPYSRYIQEVDPSWLAQWDKKR
jgi:hypothetical protein